MLLVPFDERPPKTFFKYFSRVFLYLEYQVGGSFSAVFRWHGGGKKREKKREKREKEREKKRKKKEKKKRKKRKKKRKEEKKEEEKIGRKTRKGDNEAYYSYQK